MVFAIETSTELSGIAIVSLDGELLAEKSFEGPRLQTGPLFSIAHELFEQVVSFRGKPEFSAIVAGTGPGSYSGVRVAIAAAQGMAQGLGVPATGFSSLLSLADGRYAAVGNARGGHFFFAIVQDAAFIVEPQLCQPNEALELASAEKKAFWVGAPNPPSANLTPAYPSAVRLAKIAAAACYASKLGTPLPPPTPLYLKQAHITQPKNRPRAPAGAPGGARGGGRGGG
ncbi:MAG: tRNA (adenosine(37)-N6)-threonylcarbamoyltransferase complex dimerization subunit type 1 TsaB, partial [Chthoniobacterales bacterium]|nr:tRNA (adenosine(37)-N6)-threonylcarbamoyltransferase complex dimerization subunit type 1 TsaB [Chthoniobacterales bacterium]